MLHLRIISLFLSPSAMGSPQHTGPNDNFMLIHGWSPVGISSLSPLLGWVSRKNTVSTSPGNSLLSLWTDTAQDPGSLLQPCEDLTWNNHHSRTPLHSISCWTCKGSYQSGCFPCFLFKVFKIHMPYDTQHNQSHQGLPRFRMMVLKSPRSQLPSSCNCKQQLPLITRLETSFQKPKGMHTNCTGF